MKKILVALVMASTFTGAFANQDALVQGNNTFTLDLYRKLTETEDDFVVSPFNLSTTLSMAYLGAENETAKQMQTVLHYPAGGSEVAADFHQLLAHLQEEGRRAPYQLSLANSIWLDRSYTLLPTYRNTIREDYHQALFLVDFAKPEFVIDEINGLVASETDDQITDLVREIDSSTRMLLVSALYLKAPWMFPFDPSDSDKRPFAISKTHTVEVPMMRKTLIAPYLAGPNFEMCAIPYASVAGGPQLAMLVILPNDTEGLAKLEKQLSEEWLATSIVAMESKRVGLELPRFSLSTRLVANTILQEMGLTAAFSNAANFSGISGKPDLQLTSVVHQAFVQVHEEGTEAGAASAAAIGVKAMPPPKAEVIMRINHPFFFVIFDDESGQFLFMGRVTNPKLAK